MPVFSPDGRLLKMGMLANLAIHADTCHNFFMSHQLQVQFQRDCTDAELLELWSLASKAMDVTAHGRQVPAGPQTLRGQKWSLKR